MRVIHVLIPGWVRSRNDGDRHYIGVGQLARLSGLSLASRDVISLDETPGARTWLEIQERQADVEICRHYPSSSGFYKRCGP